MDQPPGASRPAISIIIPAYREQARVQQNIKAICSAVESILKEAKYEIILAENGSLEAELPKLNLPPQVVLAHTVQKGRGPAIGNALAIAQGDLVAVLSIDRAWNEKFLALALAVLEDQAVSVVFGQKSHPHSKVRRPFHRRLFSKFSRIFVSGLFNIPVQDTQCIKLFRKSRVTFSGSLGSFNYFAETEFFLRARWHGLVCRSVPVEVNDSNEDSKVKISSLLEFLLEATRFRLQTIKGHS